MSRLFARLWPSTLRMQLMLILLPVVGLPIIATGYVLQLSLHQTIIEEKQSHLQGITALLEKHLISQGGYSHLLSQTRADRSAQIRVLNQRLREYTDRVAESFPGVGVGYYHYALNAVITYGPSTPYEKTVGTSISEDHPGWKVMREGQMMTVSGLQVRGNIMNAMRPIREKGDVVGYIWANELIDDIDRQARRLRMTVYSMTLLGFMLALIVVFFTIAQLANGIAKIRQGLYRLRFDLEQPILPIKGEMGEIAHEINSLASSLLETRSMHHNILDSLSDAVMTVDSAGNVAYINPAASLLFGQEAMRVIGKDYRELLHAHPQFSSLLQDTLHDRREHRGIELDYPLETRQMRMLASTSQYFDGRGRPLGAVAILRDISETFFLREQVVRADRLAAIGEMAAGIAHELRTPLTSIRGFVQYLQGSKNPEEWQNYGPIIIREVDGLNRIVSELLDLVRKQPLLTQPAEINQLIEEVLLLARDSVNHAQVNFRLYLAPNLPHVDLDRGQIKQVLLNLIINALQAIRHEGEIVIKSAQDGQKLVITITDNGCGISRANCERIFDPFFSTKPNGTGIGMTIARRIMTSHQGEITLESIEHKGTTVRLSLPIRRVEDRLP